MPEYAALITALILERPMCLQCIGEKANMSLPSVRAYLEQISRACGNTGPAVSIGRAD
jgi:hypothetical protein